MSPYRPDNLLNGSRTSTPRKGRVPTMGRENGPGGRLVPVDDGKEFHSINVKRVIDTVTSRPTVGVSVLDRSKIGIASYLGASLQVSLSQL